MMKACHILCIVLVALAYPITQTALRAQQAKGPILRVKPEVIDFDTAFCGTTKCSTIVFSNMGDTLLRVSSMDAVAPPFNGSIPSSFSLNPGESRSYPVCYRRMDAPIADSQRVGYVADNRVSISVSLLFDVSGSMQNPIGAGDSVQRIDAAHDAGLSFVQGLLDTPEATDEASIIRFADRSDYMVLQDFTTNKTALSAAIPAAAPGSQTCIYDALRRTITGIAGRRNRKIIILLTDGGDSGAGICGAETPVTVIGAANAADIRIFTIGIGNADPALLAQIASETGGAYFTADSRSNLIGVYRTIATLLSRNMNGSFLLRGRSVSPVISITAGPSIDFDSVRIGQGRCVPVTVRNTGTAPLTLTAVTGLVSPFRFQPPPGVSQLPPGMQSTFDVCFIPDRLRVQTALVTLHHNSCGQQPVTINLRGVGYDSVAVALVDTVKARPGSLIRVPVYLRSPLPAAYEVKNLLLRIRYNQTVLIPSGKSIQREATLSRVMPLVSLNETYLPEYTAEMQVALSGGVLVNSHASDTLIYLGFLVLHGNSLSTPIELFDVLFEDGNPRVGRMQPGLAVADSLCNQRERLVSFTPNPFFSLAQNVPNPFNPVTRISFRIAEPGWIRLTVFDALGRGIGRLVDEFRHAGQYDATFDGSRCPGGMYYYRLEAGGVSEMKKMILVK